MAMVSCKKFVNCLNKLQGQKGQEEISEDGLAYESLKVDHLHSELGAMPMIDLEAGSKEMQRSSRMISKGKYEADADFKTDQPLKPTHEG